MCYTHFLVLYPVHVLYVGKSYISKPETQFPKKTLLFPIYFSYIDIHAREWVSAAVLTYLANQLLEESPGADWTDRFWDLDWYFVSNVNPVREKRVFFGKKTWILGI